MNLIRVSSKFFIYGKYLALIILLTGNFLFLTNNEIQTEQLIAFNGAGLLTFLLIAIYVQRFWQVYVNGQTVIANRFKKTIEFTLGDIKNVNIIPDILFRGYGPPVVNIFLNKEINGVLKFSYYPPRHRADERLLIGPWKKKYHEWTQQSLKNKRARR